MELVEGAQRVPAVELLEGVLGVGRPGGVELVVGGKEESAPEGDVEMAVIAVVDAVRVLVVGPGVRGKRATREYMNNLSILNQKLNTNEPSAQCEN